jgi:NADH:ubiquinone oxidoreductase subunit E
MNDETENTRCHIKICLGSSCRRNGAPEVMAQLQAAFTQDEAFEVHRYFCFGACNAGPNIVVIPNRLWFSFVIPAYVDDVVSAIRRGEELPSLARHVRPDIREAVLQSLEAKHAKPPEPAS